ncbi:MAG: outer membrane protein assembly factor BamB family protein [Thermoguttaceae bacterium]
MSRTLSLLTFVLACLILASLPALAAEPGSGAQPGAQAAPRPAADPGKVRTWTDASGQFTIEAAMVAYAEGQVQLRRADGSLVAVPVNRLSKSDRSYIVAEISRRRSAERRAEPKPEADPDPSPVKPDDPAPAVAGIADWPGWRGPARDGKSPDTGLLKTWPEGGPPLLWRAQGIGSGYASIAVVDGKVYTTGQIDERLVISVFDTEGKRLAQVPHDTAWTKNYPGSRSTPTLDGGNLYLVSGHGLVGCYDTRSMRARWSVRMSDFGGSPPEWGYAESVLILGELAIITPGGSKCIVALNKNTGQPVWASSGFQAGAQYSSCFAFQFGGVPIIAAGTHGGLVGVDARNGRALFTNPFAEGNTASCPTPVAADGYVFWAVGYGKGGICLKLQGARDRITADQAWTTGDMDCQHGGYIVHEGHVYGNNGGAGWACIELTTGKTVWKERGVGKGSVCFADGMLYLFAENGGRAALATCSPEGLEMRGEFSVEGQGTSWAHPVVIGGRLYLRYDDNLYCFNVKGQ